MNKEQFKPGIKFTYKNRVFITELSMLESLPDRIVICDNKDKYLGSVVKIEAFHIYLDYTNQFNQFVNTKISLSEMEILEL